MALTAVIDTRFILTLEFPPNQEAKEKTRNLFEKELKQGPILPTIVITEFIEIAGARIGEAAAKNRFRLLKERGMEVASIDEECGIAAGTLLLSHRNIPIADALISSLVTTGLAEYVLTDDSHYKMLNVKTKWIP